MSTTHWFLILLMSSFCYCNKYSKKANTPEFDKFQSSEEPFRIRKLNLVWQKASKKLPPEKLRSLYSDLKFQDKQELTWKKQKSKGVDKDGLQENLIVESFNAILNKYFLQDEFKALQDAALISTPVSEELSKNMYFKNIFKDKKLNKLWLKAEQQGFTDEQLMSLKEEFLHHQNKIDQYYQILNQLHTNSADDKMGNAVENVLYSEVGEKLWKADNPHQILKEKHSDLKAGYDYLNAKIMPDIRNTEFEEPQVNSLWEMAKNVSFSNVELESLKKELHHFEHRVKKLKTLMSMEEDDKNNVDEVSIKRAKKLKEYNYKVEKLQRELTNKIIERHSEL